MPWSRDYVLRNFVFLLLDIVPSKQYSQQIFFEWRKGQTFILNKKRAKVQLSRHHPVPLICMSAWPTFLHWISLFVPEIPGLICTRYYNTCTTLCLESPWVTISSFTILKVLVKYKGITNKKWFSGCSIL